MAVDIKAGCDALLAPLHFTWIGSPNHDSGRGLPIDCVVVHHCAGFGMPDAAFLSPGRQASSTVAIQGREVHAYVANENAPWTNGVWAVNQSSLTQELVNITGEPDWQIAEDTFDSSARLTAVWHLQYNLGRCTYDGSADGTTLYSHCDLVKYGGAATACPGPWFIANRGRYVALVNKYIDSVLSPSAPQTEKDGRNVSRISGNNRHETAAKVAQSAADKSKVVLVGGSSYPDAACAGVYLAKGYPLLMCDRTVAPQCTLDFCKQYKGIIKEIVVIGGEASVSAAVANAVAKAAGLQ